MSGSDGVGEVLHTETQPLPDGSFAAYTELRVGASTGWGVGFGRAVEETVAASRRSAAGRLIDLVDEEA